MKSFSEATHCGGLIESLRWGCVLPAAVLGAFTTQFILAAVVQFVRLGGLYIPSDSTVAYWLWLLVRYVAPKGVFVVAGAKMAPRFQAATAGGLAILGICLSFMIHLIGQQLAGNRLGIANYTHFIAESVGVLGGAAGIVLQNWRNNRANVRS